MLDTVKAHDEISQELKQYLRQRGKLCLREGVLYWHSNWARWDCNELQLVVLSEYRLENDVGHLSLKWILDILQDRFYWPNLEADATHQLCTCEWCLKFKSRQDKEELYPLLATYPQELVHMDFLTIENPHTDVNVNILAITHHFMQYAKAVETFTQTAKAMAIPFWNGFITNYGFPKNLLTDQGCNFESQLIKELCKLANIQRWEQHHITQRQMASVRD